MDHLNDSMTSSFDLYSELIGEDAVRNVADASNLEITNRSLTSDLAAANANKAKLQSTIDVLSSNFHSLWLCARKQVNDLLSETELLKNSLSSPIVLSCPMCRASFRANPISDVIKRPRNVKVIKGRKCVEVQFNCDSDLELWLAAYGLTRNTDGLPTLPEKLNEMLLRNAKKPALVDVSDVVAGASVAEAHAAGAESKLISAEPLVANHATAAQKMAVDQLFSMNFVHASSSIQSSTAASSGIGSLSVDVMPSTSKLPTVLVEAGRGVRKSSVCSDALIIDEDENLPSTSSATVLPDVTPSPNTTFTIIPKRKCLQNNIFCGELKSPLVSCHKKKLTRRPSYNDPFVEALQSRQVTTTITRPRNYNGVHREFPADRATASDQVNHKSNGKRRVELTSAGTVDHEPFVRGPRTPPPPTDDRCRRRVGRPTKRESMMKSSEECRRERVDDRRPRPRNRPSTRSNRLKRERSPTPSTSRSRSRHAKCDRRDDYYSRRDDREETHKLRDSSRRRRRSSRDSKSAPASKREKMSKLEKVTMSLFEEKSKKSKIIDPVSSELRDKNAKKTVVVCPKQNVAAIVEDVEDSMSPLHLTNTESMKESDNVIEESSNLASTNYPSNEEIASAEPAVPEVDPNTRLESVVPDVVGGYPSPPLNMDVRVDIATRGAISDARVSEMDSVGVHSVVEKADHIATGVCDPEEITSTEPAVPEVDHNTRLEPIIPDVVDSDPSPSLNLDVRVDIPTAGAISGARVSEMNSVGVHSVAEKADHIATGVCYPEEITSTEPAVPEVDPNTRLEPIIPDVVDGDPSPSLNLDVRVDIPTAGAISGAWVSEMNSVGVQSVVEKADRIATGVYDPVAKTDTKSPSISAKTPSVSPAKSDCSPQTKRNRFAAINSSARLAILKRLHPDVVSSSPTREAGDAKAPLENRVESCPESSDIKVALTKRHDDVIPSSPVVHQLPETSDSEAGIVDIVGFSPLRFPPTRKAKIAGATKTKVASESEALQHTPAASSPDKNSSLASKVPTKKSKKTVKTKKSSSKKDKLLCTPPKKAAPTPPKLKPDSPWQHRLRHGNRSGMPDLIAQTVSDEVVKDTGQVVDFSALKNEVSPLVSKRLPHGSLSPSVQVVEEAVKESYSSIELGHVELSPKKCVSCAAHPSQVYAGGPHGAAACRYEHTGYTLLQHDLFMTPDHTSGGVFTGEINVDTLSITKRLFESECAEEPSEVIELNDAVNDDDEEEEKIDDSFSKASSSKCTTLPSTCDDDGDIELDLSDIIDFSAWLAPDSDSDDDCDESTTATMPDDAKLNKLVAKKWESRGKTIKMSESTVDGDKSSDSEDSRGDEPTATPSSTLLVKKVTPLKIARQNIWIKSLENSKT